MCRHRLRRLRFSESRVRFVLIHKTNFGDEKFVQQKHKPHFVFVSHKHKINFGVAPLYGLSKIEPSKEEKTTQNQLCRTRDSSVASQARQDTSQAPRQDTTTDKRTAHKTNKANEANSSIFRGFPFGQPWIPIRKIIPKSSILRWSSSPGCRHPPPHSKWC